MAADPLSPLRAVVDGLTYPSESDEPFDVFVWNDAGTNAAAVAATHAKGRRVMEVPVPAFFDALKNSDDADRFAQLRKVLDATLQGLRVFRVGEGEVEVDVYLIGRSTSGQWAGAHTRSVET